MDLSQSTCSCRTFRAKVRRQHLTGIARTLFIKSGFHATGIAQIATASGISATQIYRDFESKEHIIADIVAADLAEFLDCDGLSASVEADDTEAIRHWVYNLIGVNWPLDKCRMMAEIVAEAARNMQIANIYREIDRRIRGNLTKALVALIPDLDCAGERENLSEFILALGTGLINRRLVEPDLDRQLLVEFIREIVDREIAAMLTRSRFVGPHASRPS